MTKLTSASIGKELRSGLVVFLVAIPLCLGIALASGAPAYSGLIAGVVGGIVVGLISKANVAVSGPAAGLAVIVLDAIHVLPSFQAFLLAVFLTGVLQLILFKIKAGVVGDFIPTNVIKGMLTAIGLILVIKEIPHAVGLDNAFPLDISVFSLTGKKESIPYSQLIQDVSFSAITIAVFSWLILVGWEFTVRVKQIKVGMLSGPLLAVFAGSGLNLVFQFWMPSIALGGNHLVTIPLANSWDGLLSNLNHPDFNYIFDKRVWLAAATITVVATLECLLSIEASDKLDPLKRITPVNGELKAQGIGNIISSCLGGLPITTVIVRSSVNVSSGGLSKISTITHGVLLLLSIVLIPSVLNHIPLACLAAILLQVGWRLINTKAIKGLLREGLPQFLPFLITVIGMLAFNLLIGIALGMVSSFYFITKANYKSSVSLTQDGSNYLLKFRKDTSFLTKGKIKELLKSIPDDSKVLIDHTKADFIDFDVVDVVNDFIIGGKQRNIKVVVKESAVKLETPFEV